MSQANPYQPPRTNVEDQTGDADIDSLPVSDKWKQRFKGIKKAGGPAMPHFKQMSKEDRKQVGLFNVLAFLFGPIYYIAKGMWKRALSLFFACFVVLFGLAIILEWAGMGAIARFLGYGAAAVFAVRANIDYYKKMVLNDNGWW